MTPQSRKGLARTVAAGVCVFGVALMTMPAHGQIAISEDSVTFPNGTEPVTALKQYEIGDVGPAGGRVFYVTADGLHGLEAARDDSSVGAEWGCKETDLPGAAATGIGTGASNTEDYIQGCTTVGIAGRQASEYVAPPNGYIDWYLPSKDELDLMYDNIGPGNLDNPNIGGFVSGLYWSSSEFDRFFAWHQSFADGTQSPRNKDNTDRVRAVRAF